MIDDPNLPPVGVGLLDDGTRAYWRVWAPRRQKVELVRGLDRLTTVLPMRREPRGTFVCETDVPQSGERYRFALDGGEPLPDPLSRWQPDGVGAASAVWFSQQMAWDDGEWSGIARDDLVIYELHVGTFTREGTFDAVIPRLASLRELGITAIELMPVSQFSGSRGWGYDAVFPFAVQNSYGGPAGLQRLVEAAHREGLAVILDVIYNHFGPEGNVLPEYGLYLTDRYHTDWGPAVNYDGPGSDFVRTMVLDNVRMWVRDYHVDGLRLDAADQIYDRRPHHILSEVVQVAHAEAAQRGWPCHIFAETDMNDAHRFLAPPETGGYSLDGQWNDDFHHAVHVVLTGDTSGYFVDFADGPASLAKVYSHVFVNNGIYSKLRDRRHGAPATEFSGKRFVAFVQNHDQVANGNAGRRHAAILAPGQVRLAAGLLLLAPRLPLLFMGEEYGETNPFPFFCDYADPQLREAVRTGRQKELAAMGGGIEAPDPVAVTTREATVLSWSWADPARAGLRRLYQDLLRLRRTCPALRDGSHAQCTLLDGGHVLLVVRGSGLDQNGSSRLTILFNLSGSERAWPETLLRQVPKFRSEASEYGADQGMTSDRDGLAPYEFVIFGPLAAG